MCGRYILTSPIDMLRSMFDLDVLHAIPPRYNIAPRQPVLVIRQGEQGTKELAAVEWGLVPEWKKEKGDKPLINARIETVIEKPSFRSSIKRRRCLVPMNGWYEWKLEHGIRRPYWIKPTNGEVAAFAGIWTVWHGPAGEFWLETMAILTAPTSGSMKSLHHRRPLVVAKGAYNRWLEPHDPLPRGFLDSFDWVLEHAFEWQKVSLKVNSVHYEGAGCLQPAEDDRQTTLF
ncbi:SOS response-associated peptidase [Kordiimonas pumila]|uniref:Abasic site processing protein n=1 Tax=Kordiimonas pumila TaxID=2161677 RepID=A0ABV7D7X5_9PROT|nr:SOS response-associated peptidase [Kordiimonas pumila]